MGKGKRLKRVFIDLEYIQEKDLERALNRIKEEIIKGVESQEIVYERQKIKLVSTFKQWYPIKIHEYSETKENESTIFIVKSKI
tara:strand:+ start:18711 stop:18962 length:252 start_codon:yes stop_codon:yes gene_type:complete